MNEFDRRLFYCLRVENKRNLKANTQNCPTVNQNLNPFKSIKHSLQRDEKLHKKANKKMIENLGQFSEKKYITLKLFEFQELFYWHFCLAVVPFREPVQKGSFSILLEIQKTEVIFELGFRELRFFIKFAL